MNVRSFAASWLAASSLVLGAASAAAQYAPARLKSGDAPAPPPNAVGWAWDVADVTVDAEGRPGSWGGIYGTQSWSGFVWKAVVNNWSFEPASDGGAKVEGHVLVAACYRPASLETGPEIPMPGVQERPGVPSPAKMVPPAYSPRALGNGVVIVELRVDATGRIAETRIVKSAAAFDQAALEAARQWQFQPAQRAGAAVSAYVYIIFGFRQPVT